MWPLLSLTAFLEPEVRVECWLRTSVPAHPKGCCCWVYKGTASPQTPRAPRSWLLRNRQKCQWKKATGDYNPSTDPINRLARHEQTTIFRLRTGHCGLRAHLKRIGIMDSALCDCKEAEQTVHHILQDCPIWRKQRHQLWPQGEPTTNKLWGTAEDLRRTTQFMTTCGLRV